MGTPFPRFAIDKRLPIRVMSRIDVQEEICIDGHIMRVKFSIPEGFWHDGNSVPMGLRSIISPMQLAGQGVKHDFLYRYGAPFPEICPLSPECKEFPERKIADCLYRHCLNKYNSITAEEWKRTAAYWAVRICGRFSYKKKAIANWAEKMERQYQMYLSSKKSD